MSAVEVRLMSATRQGEMQSRPVAPGEPADLFQARAEVRWPVHAIALRSPQAVSHALRVSISSGAAQTLSMAP